MCLKMPVTSYIILNSSVNTCITLFKSSKIHKELKSFHQNLNLMCCSKIRYELWLSNHTSALKYHNDKFAITWYRNLDLRCGWCNLFYRREPWASKFMAARLEVQKVMSQRSTDLCNRCTYANAFPIVNIHILI